MKKYIRLFLVLIIIGFLSVINLKSQYCTKTCEEGEFSWGQEIYCITQLQQYPNCTIRIWFQRGFCGPIEIGCLIRINKLEFVGGNCPSPSLLTIPEFIRLTTEAFVSNSNNWSCLLPSCQSPNQQFSPTVEIWHKSPCWQWYGLIEPSEPPPPLVPCGEEGCCKVTYVVHYINDNTYQPVRLFQQVVGLCQPNYPDCINICE